MDSIILNLAPFIIDCQLCQFSGMIHAHIEGRLIKMIAKYLVEFMYTIA